MSSVRISYVFALALLGAIISTPSRGADLSKCKLNLAARLAIADKKLNIVLQVGWSKPTCDSLEEYRSLDTELIRHSREMFTVCPKEFLAESYSHGVEEEIRRINALREELENICAGKTK